MLNDSDGWRSVRKGENAQCLNVEAPMRKRFTGAASRIRVRHGSWFPHQVPLLNTEPLQKPIEVSFGFVIEGILGLSLRGRDADRDFVHIDAMHEYTVRFI